MANNKNRRRKRKKQKSPLRFIVPGTLVVYLSMNILSSATANEHTYVLNKEDIISSITNSDIYNYVEDILDDSLAITTEDISVLSAVEENETLSEREKELFYSLSNMIDDNPYLNKKNAYSNIKNLQINYDCARPLSESENVMAVYNNNDDTIDVYSPEAYTDDEIILHEMVHAICINKVNRLLPDYFIEGITEQLVNEYCTLTPYMELNTYPYEVTMSKIFCELVGNNEVLRAFSKGNMNIIINDLEDIGGTEVTEKFLNSTERVFKQYENNQAVNQEDYDYMLNYLDSYFSYLYNTEGDQEKFDRYLYYRGIISLINKSNSYDEYLKYIENNSLQYKTYFNNNSDYSKVYQK